MKDLSVTWARHPVRAGMWPVALCACFLAAYLITPTCCYTFDSIAYANQIRSFSETGRVGWLFHPHHLFFNSAGLATWRGLDWLGTGADPLRSLQAMNAMFAAAGLALIYAVLQKGRLRVSGGPAPEWAVSRGAALAVVAVVGAAYGYWVCATDGRVNMPGLVLVITTLGLAWGMLTSPSMAQCAAMAVGSIVAVGFHQGHGLMAAACVGAALLCDARPRDRARYAALYVAFFAVGVAAMYGGIGVGTKGLRSYEDLREWALAYARDGRWWSFDIRQNLLADRRALVHTVLASRPAEAGPAGALPYLAFAGAMMAIPGHAAALIRRSVCRGSTGKGGDWRPYAVLAMMAAPYCVFFTFWTPGYFVFWLPVMVAAVVWLAVAVDRLRGRWRAAAATLCICWVASVLMINLQVILPKTRSSANPNLALCRAIAKQMRRGDLLLATGVVSSAKSPFYVEVYVPYFAGVSVKAVTREIKNLNGNTARAVRWIRGVVRDRLKAGHRVAILSEFLNHENWRRLGGTSRDGESVPDRILEGYRLRPFFVSGDVRAFELLPRDGPHASRLRQSERPRLRRQG